MHPSQRRAKPDGFHREGVESRRRAPTVFLDYGEGVLQPTNHAPHGQRKLKWDENPSPQGVPVQFRPRAPSHSRAFCFARTRALLPTVLRVHIGCVNIRISIHSQFLPCASGATKPSTWAHARALWLCRWGTRPPFPVLPLDIPNGTSRGRQGDGGDELTASASTASDPSWDRHSAHPWGVEPAGLPWQGLHAPCLPWPC